MEFTLYEPWMHEQIINLFVSQYNVPYNNFDKNFKNFYFHSFQKEKAIMIVAIDGKTIAGFQSFFYWPMTLESKNFTVYQSGNSLVNPAYRGQRLFNKMLEQITLGKKQYPSIDFLIGFPVEASFKSFLRDGWSNPFDLAWYIKIINPIGGIFPIATAQKSTFENDKYIRNNSFIQTNQTSAFNGWRKEFGEIKQYFQPKGLDIILEYKVFKRKRFINELTVGNFYGSFDLLESALSQLTKMALKKFNVSIVSFAISSDNQSVIGKLKASGFKKIDKKIHFIYKPMNLDPSNINARWLLTRGDIDTW